MWGSNSNMLNSSAAYCTLSIRQLNAYEILVSKYTTPQNSEEMSMLNINIYNVCIPFIRAIWEGSIWKLYPPLNSGDILNFFPLNVFIKVIGSWTNHSDVLWPAIPFRK